MKESDYSANRKTFWLFPSFDYIYFFLRFLSKAYCAQSSPDWPSSLKNDREVLGACIGSAQWHPLKSL